MTDREQLKRIEQLKKIATEMVKHHQYEQAIEAAEQILAINEKSCEGLHALALCHMQMERYDEATAIAEKILAIDAEYWGAYIVLAHLCKRRQWIAEEIKYLRLVVSELERQQAFSRQELRIYSEASSLLGSAYALLGKNKQAQKYFLDAVKIEPDMQQQSIEYSNFLFVSNYRDDIQNEDMLVQHRQFNVFFREVKRYFHGKPQVKKKIRLGYISPDFRTHAVAFFAYVLLTQFNTEVFEVFCYSSGRADELTAKLKKSVSCWRDVRGLTPDETAKLVYEDGIDILIDLAGHTAKNNLSVLARKPAPVQVSGIGYFNTTGLKEVDYFLTDIHCDPIGQNDAYFSERLVRLPHSHLCYCVLSDMPVCADPPFLMNGYVTFGCFNNFSKVTNRILQLWGRILKQLPKAKLVLKSRVFGSAFGRESANKRFTLAGIDPQRVELRLFTAEYLHEYQEIDIALDTYPYPGGATTCEALYMGVPVVTMTGSRHGARFGYSLLKNVGMGELIADNETEYVDKAINLAVNKDRLQLMHKNLRKIMQDSTLMNGKQYLSDVEAVYKEMWKVEMEKYYPLVSIFIPVFQRPSDAEIALQNALRQVYPNIEIIIFGNRTGDESAMLRQKYKNDARIIFACDQQAKSKEENFHSFEQLAKGKYLLWLMDDGVSMLENMEKMIACFDDNPDVSIVTSCRSWIDEKGAAISRGGALEGDFPCMVMDGYSLGKSMLLHMENVIDEPAAFLFKKEMLKDYHKHMACCGFNAISDIVMGLALMEKGNCTYFSVPSSDNCIDEGQEGKAADMMVLGRIEWLTAGKEYYSRRKFIETEAEYTQMLEHWLADAKGVLVCLKECAEIDYALLKRYMDEIKRVNLYLNKKKRMLLLEEKFRQSDFAGIITLLIDMLKECPDDGDLLSKLASAYIESGRGTEAEATAEKLLALYPEDEFAVYLNARVQYMKGNFPLVISKLEQLVEKSQPLGGDESKSLICNLLANCYGLLGDCEKSTKYYWQASRYSICERDKAIDYSNYLFHLHYLSDITQQEMYEAHCGYQEIFHRIKPYTHDRCRRQGRLRIGYISADLREHVVTFFSYALFAAYDREKFTVICFSNGKEDEVSKKIRVLADGWFNIRGINADEAAQIIYEQQIDILVDLSGHTKNNCLPILARRPAPIQICGIGYFDTTGMECVDYFLTDVYCDPVGQNDTYFRERLLRMPHSHFCYTSLREDVYVDDMPNLNNGYITFSSFNNFAKVNDEVLLVWKEILLCLPDARLVLKSGILGNRFGLDVVRQRFIRLGMPLDRIEFRGESYPYMQEYNDIDIALDTFPYPGGGTTCDALYMGVPVITLAGERHGARFGYSILKNIGMEELSATCKSEYVDKAVLLAKDKELLVGLRKNLRSIMQKSALMDAKEYMNELEGIYLDIYRQYAVK